VNERGRIDLATKAADEHFDQFHVVFVFTFPDFFTKFGSGEDPARFAHEDAQEREFAGGELDFAAASEEFIVRQVEDEVGNLELERWGFRKPAAESADSCHQFLHGKRLCQIIVGPESETIHSIGQFTARRQNQNPAVNMGLAQAAQNLKTINSREHDIEHDQVEPSFAGGPESGLSVVNNDGVVAGGNQSARDMAGKPDFIFYDEYMHGRVSYALGEKGCELDSSSSAQKGRLAKSYRLVTFDSVLIHRETSLVFAAQDPRGKACKPIAIRLKLTLPCACGNNG
jgi:hypothetical protein